MVVTEIGTAMHIPTEPTRQLIYALVITLVSALAFSVFYPVVHPLSESGEAGLGLIGQVFAMVMALQCLRVRDWRVKAQAIVLLVLQTIVLVFCLLQFVRLF